MLSQTHHMNLSLCRQTWSSVWCNLTTTLASPGPVFLIPPIPPILPAKRAHLFTPSHQQQTDRTAPRPGIPGKNRSTCRKIDFDMCTCSHCVWNLPSPPILSPQLMFPAVMFPVFPWSSPFLYTYFAYVWQCACDCHFYFTTIKPLSTTATKQTDQKLFMMLGEKKILNP